MLVTDISNPLLSLKRPYLVQCQNVSDCILNETWMPENVQMDSSLLELQKYYKKFRNNQVEQ